MTDNTAFFDIPADVRRAIYRKSRFLAAKTILARRLERRPGIARVQHLPARGTTGFMVALRVNDTKAIILEHWLRDGKVSDSIIVYESDSSFGVVVCLQVDRGGFVRVGCFTERSVRYILPRVWTNAACTPYPAAQTIVTFNRRLL